MAFKQVLYIFTLLIGTFGFSQATTPIGKKSNYIKKVVNKYHYNQVSFDDTFSEKVLTKFLTEIDPLGMHFFKQDITDLTTTYNHQIDDEIIQSTSAFFDAVAALFEKRLGQSKTRIEVEIAKEMDWSVNEVFSISPDDIPIYAEAESEMNDRWRRWLKLGLLQELFSESHHSRPNETTIDSILKYEDEAKAALLKSELYEIKQFLEHPAGFKTYLSTFYLDAIATTIDPHTTYFSANEEADFVGDLSRDNKAFGFQLDENEKGDVFIYGLQPGSPAWMSNGLNKGDIVLRLKLGNEILDLSAAGMDDVNFLFSNSQFEMLTMYVLKANGQEKEVILEKGVVYDDQDVIKNVILKGEKKVGYITLPDFYTDWGDQGTYGCANDVAKIIVKLQKESIDGLILDLRNNGGGSVREAIDLAGIFINYGPVGIVQERSREPASIKDFNKGSIYQGPLVILVNGLSASASEIFTAAMQDYNRAIVVGSTTYGKSTGQIILPLDPSMIDESLGYLKVTTSKYYRITKSTHQKEGIIPDVALPDIYDIYDYRESGYPNALIKDSVDKKVYYTPLADFPLSGLKQKSQQRLATSTFGNALEDSIDSLKKVYAQVEDYTLDIEAYQKENKNEAAAIEYLYELIEQESEVFDVINNQYDLRIMEMNAYRSKLNAEYLERLKQDIYINEAYLVLTDYIKFGSN